MDKSELLDILKTHKACGEAIKWVVSHPSDSAETIWSECDRGDWMLWMSAKIGVDRKMIALAACGCARSVLHLVPVGEDRPRIAIETAEAWAAGIATLAEVRAAADAAYAYAADAADAAAYADAAYAAYAAAADAVYAAVAAYAAAYASDARRKSLAASADIVRQHIAWEDVVIAVLRGSR